MSIDSLRQIEHTQRISPATQRELGGVAVEPAHNLIAAHEKARKDVEKTLALLRQLSEEEHGSALYELARTVEEDHLTDWVRSDRLDLFIEQVPAVEEFRNEMNRQAHLLLENGDTIPSPNEVRSLGLAADFTRDPEIIDETLRAIDDTQDDRYEPLRVALETAKEEDKLFVDVFPRAHKEYLEKLSRKHLQNRYYAEYDADDSSTWGHGIAQQPQQGELSGDTSYEPFGMDGYKTSYDYGHPGHEMNEGHVRDLQALLAKESIRR